jgi:hypothetical protein
MLHQVIRMLIHVLSGVLSGGFTRFSVGACAFKIGVGTVMGLGVSFCKIRELALVNAEAGQPSMCT